MGIFDNDSCKYCREREWNVPSHSMWMWSHLHNQISCVWTALYIVGQHGMVLEGDSIRRGIEQYNRPFRSRYALLKPLLTMMRYYSAIWPVICTKQILKRVNHEIVHLHSTQTQYAILPLTLSHSYIECDSTSYFLHQVLLNRSTMYMYYVFHILFTAVKRDFMG